MLRIDGSGTVRRLPFAVASLATEAERPERTASLFTKDTPAIRRIAPRNESVMFMGLKKLLVINSQVLSVAELLPGDASPVHLLDGFIHRRLVSIRDAKLPS